LNVGAFFTNSGTIWTAADVFNDIAESSSLSKSTMKTLLEIISHDIVQKSFEMYGNGSIGQDSFIAISSLAVTLAESFSEQLIDPLTPLNVNLLETMLFLLSTDQGSRTFNFWISFAEASVDIEDGHRGDAWLQRTLPILLDKSSWRDNVDEEEWFGYRTDVVELFEGICEVLGYKTITSIVMSCLENAAARENIQDRIVVCLTWFQS
jgi:hypothetical protein